jgi:hypothetical protein
MNGTCYAAKITAEDLRVFLQFWPRFLAERDESNQMLLEDKSRILGNDAELFAWCHLYELPFRQHATLATSGIVQAFSSILPKEHVIGWYKAIADAPSQISALPEIFDQIALHFDGMPEPSAEVTEELRSKLACIYGLGLSMSNSLRCVLLHGCFLNELIERIRSGDDKALFDAVRVDATVIGCISVSNRVTKAVLLKDNRFFAKLKAAINGKVAKREQANFQKMRLVFEVLHEAGASRLDDAQLYQLFVKELDLYSSNDRGGGNAKALRKFADTYMKNNSTT